MITVAQRPLGKEFDGSGGRIGYVVICDDGEVEEDVIEAVAAVAPSSYTGLARGKVSAKEINIDPATGEPSMWDVEVPYGTSRARLVIPPTGTVIWSGATTGGTKHVSASLSSTSYADPSVATLPLDYGILIGGTKDGLTGADITAPTDAARATKYVAATDINALRTTAYALTGKLNAAPYSIDGQTFGAREVIFLGMTWTKRTEVDPIDYECVFEFSMAPTTTVTELGAISPFDVGGWDVLDVSYDEKEEGAVGFKTPTIATVHKVYNEGDLGALGL